MEEGEPEVKRKKCYTKREALQKLEELSGNVAEVVGVYKLVNSCSHLLPQVQLLLTSAPLMQQTKIWRSTMTSWLLCSPPWKKRSTDWKLMLKTGNFDTNLAVLKRISSLVVNTVSILRNSGIQIWILVKSWKHRKCIWGGRFYLQTIWQQDYIWLKCSGKRHL